MLVTSFGIQPCLLVKESAVSKASDIPSIIPPFFTAFCACETFSNFPVKIPVTLFPNSTALSICFIDAFF